MFLDFAIVWILLSIIAVLMVWNFRDRKLQSQIHLHNIATIEAAISSNLYQLNFRSSNLQKYDFLRNNLSETLIVQPEIHL